jgi:hypothetical protein
VAVPEADTSVNAAAGFNSSIDSFNQTKVNGINHKWDRNVFLMFLDITENMINVEIAAIALSVFAF